MPSSISRDVTSESYLVLLNSEQAHFWSDQNPLVLSDKDGGGDEALHSPSAVWFAL